MTPLIDIFLTANCCNWEDDECKELTLPRVSKTSLALYLDVTQNYLCSTALSCYLMLAWIATSIRLLPHYLDLSSGGGDCDGETALVEF